MIASQQGVTQKKEHPNFNYRKGRQQQSAY